MPVPRMLFDLGLTLRPEHSAERSGHIAQLAARLGFGTVWLPVEAAGEGPPDLAARAYPADLGLVVGGDPRTLPRRLAGICADPSSAGVWLEIHAPDDLRADCRAAVGDPGRWRQRVITCWPDPEAAGLVVRADLLADRTAVHAALAAPAQAGAEHRPGLRSVALTVSIGRTVAEAQARALRDPTLSGTRHPRATGLFGTLEQAQEQALELARHGADRVRVTIADEQDVADLLAQLRAVAVGPTPVLHSRPA